MPTSDEPGYDPRPARLGAQGLAGAPLATPEDVVGRLLAVQAQDARAFRLAVRSRTRGLAATDVDAALDGRRLVVGWLLRGTLHLVRAEDYRWLHGIVAPRLLTSSRRRLEQEGVGAADAERGVRLVADAVRAGPQTAPALRGLLDAAGIRTAGQALYHVLFAAALAGHVVRGPVVGREHAFVGVDAWLGPAEPVPPQAALARLARRYLAGHGPAAPADLAAYAGIPLGAARAAFAAIAEETVQVDGGLTALAGAPPAPPLPPPRLLGGFDPLLHGWASRAALVGDLADVITSNGIFRPTALVDGRVVGTWGLAGGVLAIRPQRAIDAAATDALRADGEDVLRYLGLAGTVRVEG